MAVVSLAFFFLIEGAMHLKHIHVALGKMFKTLSLCWRSNGADRLLSCNLKEI